MPARSRESGNVGQVRGSPGITGAGVSRFEVPDGRVAERVGVKSRASIGFPSSYVRSHQCSHHLSRPGTREVGVCRAAAGASGRPSSRSPARSDPRCRTTGPIWPLLASHPGGHPQIKKRPGVVEQSRLPRPPPPLPDAERVETSMAARPERGIAIADGVTLTLPAPGNQ